MQQIAVEHSGNVRTTGPKPRCSPSRTDSRSGESKQLAFQGFIEQLLLDTGYWQAGAPIISGWSAMTRIAAKMAAATRRRWRRTSPGRQGQSAAGTGARLHGHRQRFDLLKLDAQTGGLAAEQGVSPIALPEPLKVYGLNTSKIAISHDGGEQTLAVSARREFATGGQGGILEARQGRQELRPRDQKLGVLTLGTENGETTLTRTIDTEGAEG